MQKKHWRVALTVLLSVCLLSGGGIVDAAVKKKKTAVKKTVSLSSLQQTLRHTQAQINARNQQLAEIRSQKRGVSRQLTRLDQNIEAAEKRLGALNKNLSVSASRVKSAQIQLKQVQNQVSSRNELLRKRLRAIYMQGNTSYLEVMMSAKSFGDFLTRTDLMARVMDHDLALLRQYRADQALVASKKLKLQTEQKRLESLKSDVKDHKQTYEDNKAVKQDVMQELERQKDLIERQLDDLERTSQEIARSIAAYQASHSKGPVHSGRMIWPVNGPVTSPFGWRVHPILRTRKFHTGLDIGVAYGTPIKAAQGGTVMTADWMGGYGKAITIDHGGNISTLYGHCSRLNVSGGERVKQGQVIGWVGSTGMSTGPHLHFEVRLKGQPVNPRKYL